MEAFFWDPAKFKMFVQAISVRCIKNSDYKIDTLHLQWCAKLCEYVT